MHGVDRLFNSI